jgi:hypothetical protein
MSSQLVITETYKKVRSQLIKRYPKSEADIKNCEQYTTKHPRKGDSCTGYGDHEIRKIRGKLKSYKLGKSSGLRLIYLYDEPKVVPVLIFKKGQFKQEQAVKDSVLEQLSNIISELSSK